VAIVQYLLVAARVIVVDADSPYLLGQRASTVVVVCSLGLAALAVAPLLWWSWRQSGPAGARWVAAAAALAFPTGVLFSPAATWGVGGGVPGVAIGLAILAGLAGAGVGALTVGRFDRWAPWDVLGLVGVIALMLARADLGRAQPLWSLLGIAGAGLVFGGGLTRLVRSGRGPRSWLTAGMGLAAWVAVGRAFCPVISRDGWYDPREWHWPLSVGLVWVAGLTAVALVLFTLPVPPPQPDLRPDPEPVVRG
jgi:hypothetical protein